MKAEVEPGSLFIAEGVFAAQCGSDLRKLLTRALKGKLDETAFEIYHDQAIAIVTNGPTGILLLPQEQAEAVVETLVVHGQVCAVLHSAHAEQDIKITLKSGAVKAARAILSTHGFLFIITAEDQRKLENLGETKEDRTVIVTVRENGLSWGFFIRQIMGYVEAIDRV